MIGLLMALALQAGAPAVDEGEVVVLGRRLQAMTATVGRNPQGKFTCALNQSSGNVELDAKFCKAAATCVRKGASDQASVGACIDRCKPQLLDEMRATHKAAGA